MLGQAIDWKCFKCKLLNIEIPLIVNFWGLLKNWMSNYYYFLYCPCKNYHRNIHDQALYCLLTSTACRFPNPTLLIKYN